jgi:hypothetical protein
MMLIKVDDWGVVSVGCGPLGQQRQTLGDAGQRRVGEPAGSFGDAEAVILGAPGHPEIGTGPDGFHWVVHRTPIRHDDARRSPTPLGVGRSAANGSPRRKSRWSCCTPT